MPQREVYKPPVRGGVPDAPPPDDGQRRPDAPRQRCAGCAREIAYVGQKTKANAPHQPPSQSATPTIRTHPTPAIPQPRGVEDAAPYGRVINVGISIVVNKRVNAPNLHPPLGSPERGAVAAQRAVTEGLVQRGCGVPTSSANQRRAGVEDKPLRRVGRWVRETDVICCRAASPHHFRRSRFPRRLIRAKRTGPLDRSFYHAIF